MKEVRGLERTQRGHRRQVFLTEMDIENIKVDQS